MAPGPSGLAMCLASETGLAPGGAPWRRRSNPVLRSRISPKPSWIAFHAASGERDRATTWDSSSDIATQYLARGAAFHAKGVSTFKAVLRRQGDRPLLLVQSGTPELLRQPGGFEGAGFRRVLTQPCDLAALDRDHPVDRHLDLCATALAAAGRDGGDDHLVPRIEIFGEGRGELVEGLQPLVECPHRFVDAVEGAGIRAGVHPDDLDVRVVDGFVEGAQVGLVRVAGERDEVEPLVGTEDALDQLHVLLRHRPGSIPQRSAAFHASSTPDIRFEPSRGRRGRRFLVGATGFEPATFRPPA